MKTSFSPEKRGKNCIIALQNTNEANHEQSTFQTHIPSEFDLLLTKVK
jgi:hypothetical protein